MKTIVNQTTGAAVLTINSELTSTDVMEAVTKDGGTMSRTSAKELLYGRKTESCGYVVQDSDVATVATDVPADGAVVATATPAEVVDTKTVASVAAPKAKTSNRKQRKYVPGAKVAELPQNGRLYVKLVELVKNTPTGVTVEEMYAAFPEEKKSTIQNEIWRVKKMDVVQLIVG